MSTPAHSVVVVTPQHLWLMQAIRFSWSQADSSEGRLVMDHHRPYRSNRPYEGDVNGDVASILGIPEPQWAKGETWATYPEALDWIRYVHGEIGEALSACLSVLRFDPGVYHQQERDGEYTFVAPWDDLLQVTVERIDSAVLHLVLPSAWGGGQFHIIGVSGQLHVRSLFFARDAVTNATRQLHPAESHVDVLIVGAARWFLMRERFNLDEGL